MFFNNASYRDIVEATQWLDNIKETFALRIPDDMMKEEDDGWFSLTLEPREKNPAEFFPQILWKGRYFIWNCGGRIHELPIEQAPSRVLDYIPLNPERIVHVSLAKGETLEGDYLYKLLEKVQGKKPRLEVRDNGHAVITYLNV